MTTPEVGEFLASFKTVMMASLSAEGGVHASTAPYVRVGGDFFLLISTIAQHGRNLLSSSRVSILFAEDEQGCIEPFARKRITLDAAVAEIGRESAEFSQIIERFADRFDPELVRTLANMGDFHLFKLSVIGGSGVMGFGQAYRLNEHLEVVSQMQGSHQTKESHGRK